MSRCDISRSYRFHHYSNPLGGAYREAGYAVLSYLIRHGFTTKYVPIGRLDCLPPFEQVTIEGESPDWTKVTSNLCSLVTVPQVLLAGYVAETIKHDILEDISPRKSKLIEEAESWLGAYVDEYYTGDFIKRRRDTKNLLMKIFGYVKETIQTHWASVDTLANALVQQKTLSEEKAFELIERDIPDDFKMKAKKN